MRYLCMHKLGTVEPTEVPPVPMDVVKNMGQLVGELMRKGAMENGAGLNSRYPRTRLTARGETVTEQHGPLTGTHELLAHVAMIEVKDKAEAISVGRRYLKAVGRDATLEVGRVTEPWDLGMVPAPPPPVPEKYLLLHMADAKSEAGTPPGPDETERVAALLRELASSKRLTMPLEHVRPSSEGRRLRFKSGKRVAAVDGPFAESKELISGFCLLALPTFDEVLEFADRYGAILGELEVDLLRLPDAKP